MSESLSIKLFKGIQKGREQLGREALDRVCSFVNSQRAEKDSFMDKSGKADIYYTSFGWMLSYILGIRLDHRQMGEYLSGQNPQEMDLIHYAAFMRCLAIQKLMTEGKAGFLFKSFFSSTAKIKDIGDFTDLPHHDLQSPYTRFIWLSLQEDTGQKINDKAGMLKSLADYRVAGGGYSNIKGEFVAPKSPKGDFRKALENRSSPLGVGGEDSASGTFQTESKSRKTASTNATVAALAINGQLAGYKHNDDVEYLRELQDSCGGFGAAKDAPVPDILSTATSLFMLKCYGVPPKYAAENIIEAHWLDNGGFSATLAEEVSDVEYSFYGLLALGNSI